MPKEYKTFIFLTKKNTALKVAVNKIKEISKHSKICGLEDNPVKWQKQLMKLFNDITELSPKAVVAFIHMDDVFGATLLGMLRKYTDIKILFFNHGSHYPAIGMRFCDLILEGTPTTAAITEKQRGLDNTCHSRIAISERIRFAKIFCYGNKSEKKRNRNSRWLSLHNECGVIL